MISEEKFDESKCRCPMLYYDEESDDSSFKCFFTKGYCMFMFCPVVFWINENEEMN
jgi:hypothetical protein